jgi:hypothetical protein
MNKKMTITDFKNFVIAEAIKLYNVQLFKENKVNKKIKLKENIESPQTKEQEVYDEIEMRMRPSDNRLPYDEIIEIGEEYGIDVEYVVHIMFQYLIKRDTAKEEDLKQTVRYIIDQDFAGEAPDFRTFYTRFLDYDDSSDYGTTNIEPVKQIFDKLTKDPNQLSLDIQETKKTKKSDKNIKKPSGTKSEEPCQVCGGEKTYIGPETGGWKACETCGTI